MQNDKKAFLNGIAGKLAILVGGAIAATGASATPFTPTAPFLESGTVSSPSAASQRTLAPKLLLKQQGETFKMIAQHDSHSSSAY